jgi:glycosyltransferase involved in cell wall biosynthesis
MIGQKGVPATHGGVERHVEELGARLVALGHHVTVFTRPNYTDRGLREHRGMRLVSVPTVGSKHLDAIVHSALCSFACWGGGYDVVHYHAIGPCLASPIARLRGRRVVATIHGQDWRREKWGRAASAVLRLGEWTALHIPHTTISVSETLAQDYRERLGRDVRYIPNGVSIDSGDDMRVLSDLGVCEGRYMLFAGRLVPEKGLHHLLSALAELPDPPVLVVAGDASNSGAYVSELRGAAAGNVVFAGYRYGAQLAALFRHAALFVLPSDVEGLPIVLLEAIAYGAPVLASDIQPNVEVLGREGQYFRCGDSKDLARAIEVALAPGAIARVDAAASTRDCYRSSLRLGRGCRTDRRRLLVRLGGRT